jgi:hypothetical protein
MRLTFFIVSSVLPCKCWLLSGNIPHLSPFNSLRIHHSEKSSFLRYSINVVGNSKTRRKRPLVKPRRRWKNNIRITSREIGKENVEWLHLAQNLRIGSCGGMLWTWQWTFVLNKRQGISWLAEWLSASQEVLCSMELVNWLRTCR